MTKTALVVDNDPFYRELLERLLSPEFAVRCASSGELGLEACRRERPDLLLLDLRMPGIGGAGVLAALGGEPWLGSIPVILVSSGPIDRRLRGAPGVRSALDKLAPPGRLLEAARLWAR